MKSTRFEVYLPFGSSPLRLQKLTSMSKKQVFAPIDPGLPHSCACSAFGLARRRTLRVRRGYLLGLARRRALRARRGISPCSGLRGVLRTLQLNAEIAECIAKKMHKTPTGIFPGGSRFAEIR